MDSDLTIHPDDTPQVVDTEDHQNRPTTHKSILFPIVLLIISIIMVGGLAFAYFEGKKGKNVSEDLFENPFENSSDVSPNSDPVTHWSVYQDKLYTFKYPNDWQQQETNMFGSRSVTNFTYRNGIPFTFTIQGNYNQDTGKEYGSLDEYLGEMDSIKSTEIHIAGTPAKLVEDPGDEGHVVAFKRAVLFSPSKEEILEIYYRSDYYRKENSEDILTQVLSTFRFLDM